MATPLTVKDSLGDISSATANIDSAELRSRRRLEMTDTDRKKFNPRIYGELLLNALSCPIETEAENERAPTSTD
jgi:hypothetical protein